MALYIPNTLTNVDRTIRRHVKKVLDGLSDDYIVRSQAMTEGAVSNFVIEGPKRKWLPVIVYKEQPSSFYTENWKLLKDAYLTAFDHDLNMEMLVVDWSRSGSGSDQMQLIDDKLDGSRIYGREQFTNKLPSLFDSFTSESTVECYNWLKACFFPESEIPSACTTRDLGSRDNNATLSRYFLDYDQEWASKLDLLDSEQETNLENDLNVRLINGVAGSGKTLILVNRALLYCKKYPEKNVLLLIHNKPITNVIKYRIERYWGGIPKNLEISTFHAWGLSQRKKSNGGRYIKPNFDNKNLIQKIKLVREGCADLKMSDQQLFEEITFIDENMFDSKLDYVNASRQGRGFSLRGNERETIWTLYEAFIKMTSSPAKGYLPSFYIKEMCLKKELWPLLEKYDHIMIDEAQFFAPSWFQLTKLSMRDDGQLFMCADPNQGFLKSRLSWKNVGLEVRGRTKKLLHSYRTTKSILEAANEFLNDSVKEDPAEYLVPDYSGMQEGSKPLLIYCSTPQDAVERLVNEVVDCIESNHIPLNQILILHTTAVSAWSIKKQLEIRLGEDTVWLFYDKKKVLTPGRDYIQIAQLESATGLEAGVTFVVGLEKVLDESENLDLNEVEKEEAQSEMARKIYMAMTRAGHKLIMFSTAPLPKKLESLVSVEGAIGQ